MTNTRETKKTQSSNRKDLKPLRFGTLILTLEREVVPASELLSQDNQLELLILLSSETSIERFLNSSRLPRKVLDQRESKSRIKS